MENGKEINFAKISIFNNAGSHLKRVRASISDEKHKNEVIILEDVLLVGPEPAAIWRYQTTPTLIAESVHYEGLLDRLAPVNAEQCDLSEGAEYLIGDYAILSNIWSTNFYHWFEELFRANILEQSGFAGKYIIRQGAPFIEESLVELGVSKDRIIVYSGHGLILQQVWFSASVPMYSWVERPNMFFNLREKLLPSPSRCPHRKVFMLRGSHAVNPKDIVNIDEVTSVVKQFDYEALDLATFSFADQIIVANSTQALLGMHGAGFCHALFMRRRSSVVEFFSPNYINYTTIAISQLLRHRYTPIVSQKNVEYHHGEYALVDIRLLKIVLENDSR